MLAAAGGDNKKAFCKKKLQMLNKKLKDKLISLTDEITDRDEALIDWQQKYDRQKVQNQTISEEINVIKDEYQILLESLNDFKSQKKPSRCYQCSETENKLQDLQDDNFQLRKVVDNINEEFRKFLEKNQFELSEKLEIVDVFNIKRVFEKIQYKLNSFQITVKSYEQQAVKHNEELQLITDQKDKLRDELNDYKLSKNQFEKDSNFLKKICDTKDAKIQELLQCYELKVDAMSKDYDVLHDEYLKSKKEICQLQGQNNGLTDQYDQLKNDRQQQVPLCVHNSTIDDYKNRFDDLKQTLENERIKHEIKIDNLEQKVTFLTDKGRQFDKELLEYQEQIRTLEKSNKRLQNDIKLSKDREKRLEHSRNSCRKLITKTVKFTKKLIHDHAQLLKQLSVKHKEKMAVQKDGKNLNNKLNGLKLQLKEVQKDALNELKILEEYLKEKEVDFENQKKVYLSQINDLRKQLIEKSAL